MFQFTQAHEVIKSHLICHTPDLEAAFHGESVKQFVYAYVDTANQTYHVGKTTTPAKVYETFLRWRDASDSTGLPTKMRKVLDRTCAPLLYLGADREGYMYPRLRGQLSEI